MYIVIIDMLCSSDLLRYTKIRQISSQVLSLRDGAFPGTIKRSIRHRAQLVLYRACGPLHLGDLQPVPVFSKVARELDMITSTRVSKILVSSLFQVPLVFLPPIITQNLVQTPSLDSIKEMTRGIL